MGLPHMIGQPFGRCEAFLFERLPVRPGTQVTCLVQSKGAGIPISQVQASAIRMIEVVPPSWTGSRRS